MKHPKVEGELRASVEDMDWNDPSSSPNEKANARTSLNQAFNITAVSELASHIESIGSIGSIGSLDSTNFDLTNLESLESMEIFESDDIESATNVELLDTMEEFEASDSSGASKDSVKIDLDILYYT